jgi:hypothetical protein
LPAHVGEFHAVHPQAVAERIFIFQARFHFSVLSFVMR